MEHCTKHADKCNNILKCGRGRSTLWLTLQLVNLICGQGIISLSHIYIYHGGKSKRQTQWAWRQASERLLFNINNKIKCPKGKGVQNKWDLMSLSYCEVRGGGTVLSSTQNKNKNLFHISDSCDGHHNICNILILSDSLEFLDSLSSISETPDSSNSSSASILVPRDK